MWRFLLLSALVVACASPAAAQLNMPAQLTYNITPGQHDPIPSGPVPAEKEMGALPAQTADPSGFITTTSVSYRSVTAGTSDQAKVRFTCGETGTVAFIDQIRGAFKSLFGHLHSFFGKLWVTRDLVKYFDVRRAATQQLSRGLQTSNCPGDWINGSLYWSPSVLVGNALGDGITRVKKHDFVTLYYYFDDIAEAAFGQFFRPGFRTIFGRNMDDYNMTKMQQLIADENARKPQLQLQFIMPKGHWKCEDVGVEVDSIEDLPTCPTDKRILAAIVSNSCWNGHLQASDGYSNMIPAVRAGIDGKLHCPLEYPYRLPTIETIHRYSHQGPSDYSRWYLSSDAMVGTMLGTPIKRGASLHEDYIFGWDTRFSNVWQCELGIQVPNMPFPCTPHDMDYGTIGKFAGGQVYRLLSDSVVPTSGGKLIVDLSVAHTGASINDYVNVPGSVPPPPRKGPVPIHVH